jgi:hypothetical protein
MLLNPAHQAIHQVLLPFTIPFSFDALCQINGRPKLFKAAVEF